LHHRKKTPKLKYNNKRAGNIEPSKVSERQFFGDCPHFLVVLPKVKYESYSSAKKNELQNLMLRAMKKSIWEHWKQFIKEDKQAEEAFHGEQNKTQKNTHHPKKQFNG
jgi:hypothetical protein